MRHLINTLPSIWHRIITLPSMLEELSCIPTHLQRQERDWELMVKCFPFLLNYDTLSEKASVELRSEYYAYVAEYSNSLMALTFSKAVFLYSFLQHVPVTRVHDLGSGFTSLFVRKAIEAGKRDATVISVDTSQKWLEVTAQYLKGKVQPNGVLMDFKQYEKEILINNEKGSTDLYLLDIGDFALRKQLFPILLERICDEGGYLFIDDFHVPHYRRFIQRLSKSKGVAVYSLRKHTRHNLNHAALLVGRG